MPTVRRATLEDLALVRETRLAALATDPLAFGSTLAREQAFTDSEWAERLTGDSHTHLLLSPEGNGIAVCAPAGRDRRELVSMWVAPTLRGTGAARDLFEAVAVCAHADGAMALRWCVLADNPRAIAFYDAVGGQRTGETGTCPRDGSLELIYELALDSLNARSARR